VTTNAAGNISSTAAAETGSNTATWVGGVVPTANDNVTIVDGATVTIDTAAVAYTVTDGTVEDSPRFSNTKRPPRAHLLSAAT
jgi:hypothetical protein